jgi:ubiquinone/menaquinone biosynthesis C-methylase UbiE
LATYEMEEHWSDVAERIQNRPSGNTMLAGDESPYTQYQSELFTTRLLPRVPIEGVSLLDVGCGLGAGLRWMLDHHPGQGRPARVVGCDQSSGMVKHAQENVPEAEIVQTDGKRLPFADKEFDVVYTVTVLQHNPDVRRAQVLAEICRVSTRDVFLFEETSVVMPPPTTNQGSYQNFWGRPVGWYAGVCEAHGFELVDTDRLETFVSRKVFMRLLGHLSRRGRKEGEQFSALHLAIEKRTLPVTRHLDRVIKNGKGELTLMHFRRELAE